MVAAATVAGGCVVDSSAFPRRSRYERDLKLSFSLTDQGYQPLDLSYARFLIGRLSGPEISAPADRVRAVRQHLCWLNVLEAGACSALMIDASGVYLTVAHAFDGRASADDPFTPTDSPALVCHLATGTMIPVSSYVVDGEHDLAIFNAVRGEEPRPLLGVAFNAQPLVTGRAAWMHAVLNAERSSDHPRLSRAVLKGTVNGLDAPSLTTSGYDDRLAITGMIPFGGASGSPVIDQDGKVIGVESGFFPSSAVTRSDYQGATVTRIRAVEYTIARRSIHQLRPVE
jgi:hypothetical protein